MSEIKVKLKAEIQRLLNEDIMDMVIAFKKEDSPLRPQPAFFKNPDELEDLEYNSLCQNNLATYLTRYPQDTRIGIIVRGCESRSVNALIVEKQHKRENLYMIGIPCHGIIDVRKIINRTGEEISDYSEDQDEVSVLFEGQEVKFPRKEVLHDSCLRCVHPNPVNADILLDDPLPEGDPAVVRQAVESFETMDKDERYALFRHEAERCIRCYACREACPMCYCTECFVDHATPRWSESEISPAGTHAWHIIRAFHLAGRCTSCGACERACPMDIKMTYLTDKLNENMLEEYQFEAGMDDETQPPFASFNLDDKKRFVL
ncbi:MAG: 4Fe-4S dicluster domain-containing protein [Chloroflexota bacterium]|nr:4Fe-4S dicluster domain-containing protein [Chloroflexota bacterium]